jgi:KUP system potassium uptake protein
MDGSQAADADPAPHPAHHSPGEGLPWTSRAFVALAVSAAGVVYGDIGTSPLYTWNEIRLHGALNQPSDVLGAMSLIFWTLTIIAFGKYVGLVLRADNNGEGGTFALLSQIHAYARGGTVVVGVLLVFASSLLYGEGLITPAISVLSAVEGIAVFDHRLEMFVIPITLAMLTGLFAVQYQGTDRVGTAFGVVMIVWFVAIAALGTNQIVRHPAILAGLLPHHGLRFLWETGGHGTLVVLGSVVLCITGGEALFADMGHFGARAIRAAWVTLVYPALVLQYFGQGAKLLSGDEILRDNVFFSMVPTPMMLPMVVLATAATVIASQALISGAFSLTRSAINLGLLPRVAVVHTNRHIEGQIYMPFINWALWFGCCWLVIEFGSATKLAAAYGLSVVGTMITTSVAMTYVSRFGWGWPAWRSFTVFGTFIVIEAAYLVANVVKIPDGAWLPLVMGSFLFALMQIWKRGRKRLSDAMSRVDRFTVKELLDSKARMPELSRAMVFLTAEKVLRFDDPVPLVLLKFVDRYGALPRHVTLFSIESEWAHPYWRGKRFDVRQFGDNVTSVRMHVGYMESPDTRAALVHLKQQRQIRIHATRWTIVMGREEVIIESGGGLASVPNLVFSMMMSWSAQANVWFGLGSDTGISKEVIPVVLRRNGGMEVVIRKPELSEEAVAPRTPVPAPSQVEPATDPGADVPASPTQEVGSQETEETSVHDIPRVTGTFEVPSSSPVHTTIPPEDESG